MKLLILLFYIAILFSLNGQIESEKISIRNFCQPVGHVVWGDEVCGIGILSNNGYGKCIKWKYSIWNDIRSIEDTTLCKKHYFFYYYCAIGYNSWGSCSSMNCIRSSPSGACEANIDWTSTDLSIDIDFSKIFSNNELLILSYDENDRCQISKLCSYCRYSDHVISNDFTYCEQIPRTSDNIINYSNLLQFRSYTFYLLPLVNYNTIGSIAKLELKTRLTKPNSPSNLRLDSATTNSLSIKWDQPVHNDEFGGLESYQIQLILQTISQALYTTKVNYISIFNLKENTEYCFIIIAINKGGPSLPTLPFCVTTKAEKPQLVNLEVKENSNKIGILWEINSTNCYENLYFITLVKNREDKCLFYIFLSCPTCNHLSPEAHLKPSEIIKFNQMKNCLIIKIDHFTKEISRYSTYLSKKQISSNIETSSVHIYSINEIGLHEIGNQLNLHQTNLPTIIGIYINESSNEIKVVVEMNLKHSVENYNFIITIKDAQNQCLKYVNFFSNKGLMEIKKKSKNQKNIEDICSIKHFEEFQLLSSTFVAFLTKQTYINYEEKELNISVYSIYSKGWHEIGWRKVLLTYKSKKSYMYLLYIFGSILLLLVLVGYIYFHLQYFDKRFKKSMDNISNDSLDRKNKQQKEEVSLYYDEGQLEILTKEYKAVCVESSKFEKNNNLKCSIAKLSENMTKNRFKYILPFDKSRVILKDNQDGNDYINANFIPFENDVTKSEYIACQSPIFNGVSDFWLMIWQQDISIIVMLTSIYEEGKLKCMQYWPNQIGISEDYGSTKKFTVLLENEVCSESFIERKFDVYNKELDEKRIITQLQMHTWLDHIELKFDDFERILHRFHELILQYKLEPYLIHCSGGVGRTATFIVIDRIIRKLNNGETNINIFNEVLAIRKWRNGAIQRKKQYVFIHEFIEYFQGKYVITNYNNYEEDFQQI